MKTKIAIVAICCMASINGVCAEDTQKLEAFAAAQYYTLEKGLAYSCKDIALKDMTHTTDKDEFVLQTIDAIFSGVLDYHQMTNADNMAPNAKEFLWASFKNACANDSSIKVVETLRASAKAVSKNTSEISSTWKHWSCPSFQWGFISTVMTRIAQAQFDGEIEKSEQKRFVADSVAEYRQNIGDLNYLIGFSAAAGFSTPEVLSRVHDLCNQNEKLDILGVLQEAVRNPLVFQ